jgi:hypothetical protein
VDPQTKRLALTKKAGIRLQSTFKGLCEYRPSVLLDRSGGLDSPKALRACPSMGGAARLLEEYQLALAIAFGADGFLIVL